MMGTMSGVKYVQFRCYAPGATNPMETGGDEACMRRTTALWSADDPGHQYELRAAVNHLEGREELIACYVSGRQVPFAPRSANPLGSSS